MTKTVSPPANFDHVARVYRWAEYLALGPLLQHMREHFLAECRHCCKAFAMGDGDGRFVAKLLQANADIEVVAVDTSACMLQLLRQRCSPWAARLATVHNSALDTTTLGGTDLIVTHFFLDCLTQTEVNRLIERVAGSTSAGALWLISDFGVPHAKTLRPPAALYVRLLYLAFRLLTGLQVTRLPEASPALASAGFQQIARHERLGGLLYTELWHRP